MRHWFSLRGLAVLSTLLLPSSIASHAHAQNPVWAGPVQVVIPAARFQALKLPIFPDGSPFPVQIGDRTYVFAAQGGARDAPDQGSIELAAPEPAGPSVAEAFASLGALRPLWTDAAGNPVPSLRPGFLDPPPGGNAGGFPAGASFDRDYAGGGPSTWRPGVATILQIYHGEYHADYPQGQPFYTSLGLAISTDYGRHFRKLGLAIRPEIPPDQPIPPATTIPTVPSSSGSLVEVGGYFLLYYSDISPDGTCAGQTSALKNVPCIALARARVTDVVWAARHGQVAPWRKYYGGRFEEPGVGGKFSPLIVTTGHTWARWPVVVHDPQAHLYLMADVLVEAGTTLHTAVELRQSRDGLHWDAPLQIASAAAPQELNYPGIVKLAQPETGNTDRHFAILFVRELDLATLGKPYTRDLDGVAIAVRRHE